MYQRLFQSLYRTFHLPPNSLHSDQTVERDDLPILKSCSAGLCKFVYPLKSFYFPEYFQKIFWSVILAMPIDSFITLLCFCLYGLRLSGWFFFFFEQYGVKGEHMMPSRGGLKPVLREFCFSCVSRDPRVGSWGRNHWLSEQPLLLEWD